MYSICVFAGTADGRKLVERLSGRGLAITVCVATEYGEAVLGEHSGVNVRTGRMTSREMEELFKSEKFSAAVDATHPYASDVTANIAAACSKTGTEYLRLVRDSSGNGADGTYFPDTESCVRFLKAVQGNVLLTTGSKTLHMFCADPELRQRIYARVLPLASSLRACEECSVQPDHIFAVQGPFTEEMNLAMLHAADAAYMVTKDTGAAGGYSDKISAAKKTGARALIIGRPLEEKGLQLDEMCEMLEKRFSLAEPTRHVVLAGIGMGGRATRTLGLEDAVRDADCLIGASRMLENVNCAGKRVFQAVLADDIVSIIKENTDCRNYTVLLSGDTGFYSGAKGLIERLPEADVTVLPGIGSLSYLCARLKRPWEDVRAVSLHGRSCSLVHEVRTNNAVFSLLGGADGAVNALKTLKDAGFGNLTAYVGQRLGYPEEKICCGTVEELSEQSFDTLSVLLVENDRSAEAVVTHGLPDEVFERTEVPMTKSEVRSVSLSKLMLTKEAVVYDIGSGSGSVSVECALAAPYGHVYAVEKNESAIELTKKNARRFAVENLTVKGGEAPQALADFPPPTHAFIGGSSGSIHSIVECLLNKNPSVRIVANAVTLQTAAELSEIARTFDKYEAVEMNVSRNRRLGRYDLMTAQNPVYIFTMQNDPHSEDR